MNNGELGKYLGGHANGEDKNKPATEVTVCFKKDMEPEAYTGIAQNFEQNAAHRHEVVKVTEDLIVGVTLNFKPVENYDTQDAAERRREAAKFIQEWSKQ